MLDLRRLRALAAFALATTLAVSVSMCSSKKEGPPVTDEGLVSLSVTASPSSVVANGATTDVSVIAAQEDGTIGQGVVTFSVTNGKIDNGGASATATLSNGRASVKWSCDEGITPACRGSQTVTATWATKTGSAKVEFTAKSGPPTGDGGGPDANPPNDGGQNPDTSTGVDAGGSTLSLSSSKAKIFAATGDTATLTATVKTADGGPIPNETLEFSTDLGELELADSGVQTATVTAVTAANGTAQVVLHETGSTGNATTMVVRPSTGQSAQAVVAIQTATTVTYSSTKCNGVACTIMGVKNSGFNPTAQVSFAVTDSSNQPIAGIPVTFTINNVPAGTIFSTSGITNAQGIATCVVQSGPTIGSFAVTASVPIPGNTITVSSPTIGIRGAIPSNNGWQFSCARLNVDAYNTPAPPKVIPVTCNIKMVDRFGNPIGTGTPIQLKSEAGSVPPSVNSKAFDPATAASNVDEGKAQFTFDTAGPFPPVDVPPLPADGAQFPNARLAEPQRADGLLTRNPRDGFVTLLAYAQGEEHYSDDNANGQWDPGEQFIDQGEPFVDSNDNGGWDPGETLVNTVTGDAGTGGWDGPNGKWDQNTTVWTEARILYTDVADLGMTTMLPATFPTIAPSGIQNFTVRFLDFNRNLISSGSTTISTEFLAPASGRVGTMTIQSGLSDRYGFDWQRLLVNVAGDGLCSSATPICKHKIVFKTWTDTFVDATISARLQNSAGTSPAGGACTARVKATTGAVTATVESTGALGN